MASQDDKGVPASLTRHNSRSGSEAEEGAPLTACVLLCHRLETLGDGLDLEELRRWFQSNDPQVQVTLIPDLCHGSGVFRTLSKGNAGHVVIGLCSQECAKLELQFQCRRAGLDPFGVVIVDLGSFRCRAGDRTQGMEKAKLLLAAAVAKAKAYSGSGPENLRPSFASLSQRVSRRSLFTLPPLRYQVTASVDPERCVAASGCFLCLKACPLNAIKRDDKGVWVVKTSCEACGICVGACPQRAVRLPGHTPAQLEAEINALLQASSVTMKERRLLFACQRSIAASKGAGRQGVGSLSAWLPVLVPCVGMIPISCILHVVAQGGIVGLMTCRADCPFHQSEAVQGKIGYCQQVLHLLGGSPEQVTLVSVTDRLGSELWPGSPSDAAIPTVIQGDSHPPLFGPEAMAVALFKLKEALGAPGRLSLDHPYSPLGVVAVRAQQCTGCGVCALACPTQALQLRRDHMEVALTFEPGQCIACGLCAVRCPETKAGAIRTYRVTDFASLAQGRTTLYLDSEPRCEACGATIAPRSMLKRLADLLGPDSVDLSSVIGRYCPLCRVQRGADG